MIRSMRHHSVNVWLLQALETALQPFHDMLSGEAPVERYYISVLSAYGEFDSGTFKSESGDMR